MCGLLWKFWIFSGVFQTKNTVTETMPNVRVFHRSTQPDATYIWENVRGGGFVWYKGLGTWEKSGKFRNDSGRAVSCFSTFFPIFTHPPQSRTSCPPPPPIAHLCQDGSNFLGLVKHTTYSCQAK